MSKNFSLQEANMKPNKPTPPINTNTKKNSNQKPSAQKNNDYEKDSPSKKFPPNVQSSSKAKEIKTQGKIKKSPANNETASPKKTNLYSPNLSSNVQSSLIANKIEIKPKTNISPVKKKKALQQKNNPSPPVLNQLKEQLQTPQEQQKVPKPSCNEEILPKTYLATKEVSNQDVLEKQEFPEETKKQSIIQIQKDEHFLIQRQTDKIYDDFTITLEIFGECVSYLKTKFDDTVTENAKEKLELKLNNSLFLYQALWKEASKNKMCPQLLLENLANKKKIVLEKFLKLKEILDFFGLTQECEQFIDILTDKPVDVYQFPEKTYQNISEETLSTISASINDILTVFNEFNYKKAKEVQEDKIPQEKTHLLAIDQKLAGFTQKTNFVPSIDVNYLVNRLCKEVQQKEMIYFKKMLEDNVVNPKEVDSYILLFQKSIKLSDISQKAYMEEFIKLLENYKKNFNPFF